MSDSIIHSLVDLLIHRSVTGTRLAHDRDYGTYTQGKYLLFWIDNPCSLRTLGGGLTTAFVSMNICIVWLHPLNLFLFTSQTTDHCIYLNKSSICPGSEVDVDKEITIQAGFLHDSADEETETLAWVEKNLQPKEALRSLFRATREMEKWAEQQRARWQWGMTVDFGGILPMVPLLFFTVAETPLWTFLFFFLPGIGSCLYMRPSPVALSSFSQKLDSQHFWV